MYASHGLCVPVVTPASWACLPHVGVRGRDTVVQSGGLADMAVPVMASTPGKADGEEIR